jgi:hypothetical protein
MKIQCTVLALMLFLVSSHYTVADGAPDNALDALYQAGTENDVTAFLALLSADAVFIGMDGSNRLQGQSLRRFLNERFSQQEGWGYLSRDRELRVSEDGSVAWFEESLEHDALGRGWGSGVMINSSEGWKIAQYNLTVSASNDIATSVLPISQEASTPTNNDSNDTSNAATAAEAVVPTPEKKKTCRKIRHKTNKVSNC